MNKNILNIKVQEFIRNYSNDLAKLAFAGSPFPEITVQELMQQIDGRRKVEKKLPKWFQSSSIYYPKKINLEQTSSEITARYKASLINGNSLADLTGGYGVDSFYFSESFQEVHHFELDPSLSEITAHNLSILGKNNIECIAANGLNAIDSKVKYDVIYLDPSRRSAKNGKVVFLRDCEPDVPKNLSKLLVHCDILMLKTSPMLDISAGLEELKGVYGIHIVAVNNEVKELVWLIKKDNTGAPQVHTINISEGSSERFEFNLADKAKTVYDKPKRFLYEPNAALMKSGAFDLLSQSFKLNKLHRHSHLYTNEILIDFPGRRFLIEKIVAYSKAAIRKEITIEKANITIRNFPESVITLRKKWGIKEGGDQYLFFTTRLDDQKVVLVCSKI